MAKINLTYTNIVAPVAGRVSRAEMTLGNVVSTGANAPVLTTLVSLLFPSTPHLTSTSKPTCVISVAGAALVFRSQWVLRTRLAFRVKEKSILSTIKWTRAQARFAYAPIFDNTDYSLVPGLYARIKVGGGAPHTAVLVQAAAVGTDQDKTFVLVVNESNRILYREITIESERDGLSVVTSGLGPSEKIVVGGVQRVRPNDWSSRMGSPWRPPPPTLLKPPHDPSFPVPSRIMNISKFFIERPIFAGVLSVIILLAGLISIFNTSLLGYPEIIPTSVIVRAQFPGANPKVIAETVASPLEEAINGVEDMLYMQSQANSDGNLVLTVTFKLGMNPDLAQQLIENRVSQALPRLPEDVQKLGVTTIKASPVNDFDPSICSRPTASTTPSICVITP